MIKKEKCEKCVLNRTTIECITCVTMIFIMLVGVMALWRMPKGSSAVATGSASIDFESDVIVWRGTVQVHGSSLESAYAKIAEEANSIQDYLKKKEISDEDISFGAVSIKKKLSPQYDAAGNYMGDKEDGYDLNQTFMIASDELDKVSKISRECSELIATGIQLESQNPEYHVSKETLDAVKMQLIDAASANARQRVEIMAKQAGSKLRSLTSANLGVFQITASNSGTETYSSTGTLDTTSRYKTAMITVKLNYAVR